MVKNNILPNLLQQRLYVAGFLDHNLWLNGPSSQVSGKIVTEHQLGLRCLGNLYVVGEYRSNEHLAKSQHGVGVGLQYVFLFDYQPRPSLQKKNS